jgi:hypothetical protein
VSRDHIRGSYAEIGLLACHIHPGGAFFNPQNEAETSFTTEATNEPDALGLQPTLPLNVGLFCFWCFQTSISPQSDARRSHCSDVNRDRMRRTRIGKSGGPVVGSSKVNHCWAKHRIRRSDSRKRTRIFFAPIPEVDQPIAFPRLVLFTLPSHDLKSLSETALSTLRPPILWVQKRLRA